MAVLLSASALLVSGFVMLVPSQPALADANAVIPTSPNPGTSPTTINNYQQVNLPPNDDGTWPCGGDGNAPPPCPGPGGETGPTTYPIGFNINFFGTEYNSTYVNNNGNITFGAPLSEYTPSDLTTFSNPIVAPFFADVDTRGTASAEVNFGTGTLNGQKVFVVNWPGVGCFNGITSVLDNFQLILIDRPDRGTGPLGDDFDMEFNYNSMQWDTGQASGGDGSCQNGPSGESAYAGYSNGTATAGDSYNLPGSGVPNSFLDSSTTTGLIYNDLNSTTLGRYLFTVTGGQPTAPTSLATSLSGGGQSGTSISVPAGTAVTDSATLSGTNASTATGTVTYNVYSDSACTSLVNGGSAEPITTPGTLPASQPVSLTATGTYYWQVSYSGDSANNGSVSPCSPGGANNEVETVTAGPAPTTLSTSLSGGSASGATITVPPGTPVTDSAGLSGTNASTAGGTVTYSVFSDSGCTVSAGTPTTVNVSGGSVPSSNPVTLSTPGTYYWTASYSGDSSNEASKSSCGSEKETVTSPGTAPVVEDFCNASGTGSATAFGLTASGHNDLVVAYVTAKGPASAGAQTISVSGSSLTWTRVAQENGVAGDAEVWVAHTGAKKSINVTAKATKKGYRVVLTDVSYKNATGIGASGTFHSASGAPTGSITTTQDNSWVWGVGFDPKAATNRTVGSGQVLFSQTKISTTTSWVQSTTDPTPTAGTSVTINDTAPATHPYNLVLVEIL